MSSAVVAGIAGVLIGWGIATGTHWVAGAAGAAGIIGIFVDRARLAGSAPPATITTSQAGWEDFHRELARARRYQRPVAIVRLPGAPGVDDRERAAALHLLVRQTDRVWAEHGDTLVVLAEADRPEAERVVARIRARRPETLGIGAFIATFPADGLTSGALLATLYGPPRPSTHIPPGAGTPVARPDNVIDLSPRLASAAPPLIRLESSR
jgi:hypothetical protein